MKCSEIQELLKSDYLDEEASPGIAREIKTHLAQCEQCRKLEQELAASRVIFKKAPRLEPPEQVWSNIRAAIVSEREAADDLVSPGLLERLKFLIRPSRPIFAWSGALTVFIVAAIVSGGILHKIQLAEKLNDSEFLSDYGLNNENVERGAGLGTNIEEYFL